jgi:hypothetical protein
VEVVCPDAQRLVRLTLPDARFLAYAVPSFFGRDILECVSLTCSFWIMNMVLTLSPAESDWQSTVSRVDFQYLAGS